MFDTFLIAVEFVFQHLTRLVYSVQLSIEDHQHALKDVLDESIPLLKLNIKFNEKSKRKQISPLDIDLVKSEIAVELLETFYLAVDFHLIVFVLNRVNNVVYL